MTTRFPPPPGDGDAEARRRGLSEISDERLPDVQDRVLEGLGDVDWRVRKEAVVKAVRLASMTPGLQDALVEGICDGQNVGRRNACLEVFSRLGPGGAPALLSAFPTLPPSARRFAAEALGLSGSPAAVPILLASLASSDPNLVLAALEALARVGGDEAVDALRQRLGSDDAMQQMTALQGLERLAVVVPWSDLEPLLTVPLLRRSVLLSLGRVREPDAVAPLLESLVGEERREAEAAASALAEYAYRHADERKDVVDAFAAKKGVSDTLLRHLESGTSVTRMAATELLVFLRDERCIEHVLRAAQDGTLPERTVRELRRWGASALRPMVRVSREGPPELQAVALEIAAELGRLIVQAGTVLSPEQGLEIREASKVAARSDDPARRLAAVSAALDWAEAVDAEWLLRLVGSGDPDVSSGAVRAVEAVAERDPAAMRDQLDRLEVRDREDGALLRALALVEGDAMFSRLRTCLISDHPETRRSAVSALGMLKGPEVAEYVALALGDEEAEVQLEAIRSLGAFRGEHSAVPLTRLGTLTRSPNAVVRREAARALGRLGDDGAIPFLAELARDSESGVAVAAVRALREFPGEEALSAFASLLGHEDSDVVKESLKGVDLFPEALDVAQVAGLLRHESWDVRIAVIKVLDSIGDGGRAILESHRKHEADPLVLKAMESVLSRGRGSPR